MVVGTGTGNRYNHFIRNFLPSVHAHAPEISIILMRMDGSGAR